MRRSKRIHRKTLLKEKAKASFSPIHINAEILKSDKTSALYKFTTFFFPNLGPGILNILLDMEKHSQKVIASINPEERKHLIEELEGVTVEMSYTVKEGGKEIMTLPISISPSEVLKNATLVKEGSRYNEKMQKEINNIIISFIGKEVENKIKAVMEDFLKNMLIKPKIPSMLKELLTLGFIERDGRLAEGTTIQDLISGKYAKLFKNLISEEFINEALLIKDTIESVCHYEDEDYQTLVNEALRNKGILEITLGEVQSAQ